MPLHSVRLSITRACNTCSRIPQVSSLSLTFNYIASPCFCNYCLPIIISEQYSVPHNQATIVNNISRPRNYNSHHVIRNDNGKFYYHA
uniref:Putative ovule protein n=1 Tax=Solanum chacoense TaxID=4108 RepID=A0A0V0H951_SOLCH